jgi:hypothetical protein
MLYMEQVANLLFRQIGNLPHDIRNLSRNGLE